MLMFQGSHIKIKTNTEIPVQVDGEPWLQPPGDIVVLKSALKVRYTTQLYILVLCNYSHTVSVRVITYQIRRPERT